MQTAPERNVIRQQTRVVRQQRLIGTERLVLSVRRMKIVREQDSVKQRGITPVCAVRKRHLCGTARTVLPVCRMQNAERVLFVMPVLAFLNVNRDMNMIRPPELVSCAKTALSIRRDRAVVLPVQSENFPMQLTKHAPPVHRDRFVRLVRHRQPIGTVQSVRKQILLPLVRAVITLW